MVKNGTIDRLAGVVMFDGVVPRFFWNQFGRGRLGVHSGLQTRAAPSQTDIRRKTPQQHGVIS
jgi:hypothetical protein